MDGHRASLAFLLCITLAPVHTRAANAATFNVRDYGASGNAKTLDTLPLNKAIEACAAAGGGQVLVPPGKYLVGTVHLKSNVTLLLDAGAELVGTADLECYENFTPPKDTPLVGGSLRWHRAMLLADGVENVTITGRGIINGNSVFDKLGEENVRGPHAVLLGNSKNVTIRDITIRDAGNYAILLEFTSTASIRGVTITGGYDGVHLRGWKDRPCRDVSITDCEFYTGDDCIAGWYWQDTLIDRCVLNSSCNGIRLFGPAQKTIVHSCLFFGPGRYPWRTSGLLRWTNMAAGVCIQPSAWGETEGTVDDVQISDVVMREVTTPLHVAALPPSSIGHVTVDRLSATAVYRAAASFESWADKPIDRVDLRDSSIQFVGGRAALWSDPMEAARGLWAGQDPAQVRPPGTDARSLPAWGLYARRVRSLNLANVRLSIEKQDERPAIILDRVARLDVDGLRWPNGTRRPMALADVEQITQSDPPLPATIPVVEAACLRLRATPGGAVSATVQSAQSGLAKVELLVDGRTLTRWCWLTAGESADVVFSGALPADPGQSHVVSCGSIREALKGGP
jgi:hypothetical protein